MNANDLNKAMVERLAASSTQDALRQLALDPELKDVAETALQLLAERKRATDRCGYYLSKFVTNNHQMVALKKQVTTLSTVDDPVLIQGESGTGKELIANALHGMRQGAFIAINCAGMPENLIESELFGHVKGAFTDAKTDKDGMMVAAADGTLFLDEIGDMPLALQAKLLRSIQERQVRRVGDNKTVPINCRFIAATHQPLLELIEQKRFRNDLYWRISVFELELTPLRQRRDDIPLILSALDNERVIPDYNAFVTKYVKLEELTGNVRSLQRMVRRFQLFRSVD